MISFKDSVKILTKHADQLGIGLLTEMLDEFSEADENIVDYDNLPKIGVGIDVPKACQRK